MSSTNPKRQQLAEQGSRLAGPSIRRVSRGARLFGCPPFLVILILSLLLSSGTAVAQFASWESVSFDLPAGPVTGIAANSRGDLVAGTRAGIYRYVDGQGWSITAIQNVNVYDIGVNRADGFEAAASPGSLLLTSLDGVRWDTQQLPDHLTDLRAPVIVDSLVYAHFQRSACTALNNRGSGWQRSTDGGRTWECLPNELPWSNLRRFAAIDDVTMLALTNAGPLRSTDHGYTWSPTVFADGDTLDFQTSHLATDGNGRAMIATNDFVILQSFDSAATWDSSGIVGVPTYLVTNDNGRMYLGRQSTSVIGGGQPRRYFVGGIVRSDDSGVSWQDTGHDDVGVTGLALRNGAVLAGSRNGILYSEDSGNTWQPFGSRLHNQIVDDIALDAGSFLYVSSFVRKIHRLKRGSRTWEEISPPPFNPGLLDFGDAGMIYTPTFQILRVAPDGTLYAWDGNLLRSTDEGQTWSEHAVGFIMSDLHIRPDGVLLASGVFSGAFRSTDRGASWTRLGADPDGGYALAIGPDSTLYLGGSRSFHFLTPGTDKWEHVDVSGYTFTALTIASNGYLFAGVRGTGADGSGCGKAFEPLPDRPWASTHATAAASSRPGCLLRSVDGGLTWSPVGWDKVAVFALATDRTGTIFTGQHMFIDGGVKSTYTGSGLTTTDIESLKIGNDGRLYAGTNGGGVFRSTFLVGVDVAPRVEPTALALHPPYPNPVGASTGRGSVSFPVETGVQTEAQIVVVNMLGQVIERIGPVPLRRGYQEFMLPVNNLPGGTYMLQLETNEGMATVSFVVL